MQQCLDPAKTFYDLLRLYIKITGKGSLVMSRGNRDWRALKFEQIYKAYGGNAEKAHYKLRYEILTYCIDDALAPVLRHNAPSLMEQLKAAIMALGKALGIIKQPLISKQYVIQRLFGAAKEYKSTLPTVH